MTVTEMVGDLITGHLREKLRHQEPFERPVRARLARSGRGGPSRVARGVHLRCMTPDRTEIRAHTGLETLISIAALSEVIGVPVKTIKAWRIKGEGPAAYKIGNHLRYAPSEIRAWLDRCHEDVAGVSARPGRR
jgi:predicted DNA-binding transcriptional regulator AlpA